MGKFCEHCGTELAGQAGLVEAQKEPQVQWEGIIAQLGVRAGKLDNRTITSVTWAELPLTLYAQTENATGHSTAEIVGSINEIWVDGQNVFGSGFFSNTEEGQNAAQLVKEEALLGISVDLRDGNVEISEDTDGTEAVNWVEAKIGAATLVAQPAFENARIRLVDSALKASVGPHLYPREYFAKKEYSKPQRIDISSDGEITGHVVIWGEPHRGFGNRKVTLYPSGQKLRDFNIGRTNFTDGGTMATGILTSDGLHAPDKLSSTSDKGKAMEIQAFTQSEDSRLEDVRCQFAQVFAWEDEFGIAIHGCLMPHVTKEQATRALAGCASIDFRGYDSGHRKFFGAHFVSVCGFLPPEIQEEDSERLVASAYGSDEECKDCQKQTPKEKSNVVRMGELEKAQEQLAKLDRKMTTAAYKSVIASKKRKK